MFNTPSPGAAAAPPPVVPANTLSLIAHAVNEGDDSTTSATFVEKVSLVVPMTVGTQYVINYYGEIWAPTDEDVEIECTLNAAQIAFGHFKNGLYADRWAQMNGGFFWDNELGPSSTIAINWRNGFGAGGKICRRARILVYAVNP